MNRTFFTAMVRIFVGLALLSLAQAGHSQTFSVTAVPSSLTIFPGQQNIPVAITVGASSYAGPITITMTGLPSGVTVAPLTLAAGQTGNLNVSASLSAGQEGFSPTYPSQNTSWTAQANLVAAAGSSQSTTNFALTVSISNQAFSPAASAINLPIVKIDTGGVPIVDKTTDVPGTITITSADGQTSYLPNASDSDNSANFHLHGSSTTDMPKLSYHIKLNTSLDLLNVMGLSCPYVTNGKAKPTCDKSKSYLLLANYDDKTLIHDWAASALADDIPIGGAYLGSPADSPTPSGTSTLMPWAAHSLFVELYLNGVYEGNYQLFEQIKVDSHRVNISELAETDVSDDISGGYLLEIDQHQDEAFVFYTPQGLPIGLIDPDFTPDPEIPQQTTYISNYVDEAETALFAANFTDPTLGWRAYFDEASAINFYIVNDLMGNQDAGDFYSSNYFYKSKDNPLLYMGPVWDFDISAGNVNYSPIVSPIVPWMQENAAWYKQWLTDPGFKADLVTQWNALKNNGVISAWMTSIQQEAQTLEQSQVNNFTRWPILGIEVWPNSEAAGNYDSEVLQFSNWLQLRFWYLDSLYNSKAQTGVTLSSSAANQSFGAPVTLSVQVTGGNSPAGQVFFLSNGVLLGATTLNIGTASMPVSNLQLGANSIQAVYGGDQNNALSTSAPLSVAVSPAHTPVAVSVSVPATAYFGFSIDFAAAVIAQNGAAIPTGQVSFSVDGGSGVAVLLNGKGVATYTTASLALGAHTIIATFGGDANYNAASGSSSVNVTIQPGFSISGSSVSVKAGATSGNTSTLTITPAGGFAGAVTLSAVLTNQPIGAENPPEFSFGTTNPVNITGASAQTATLTVTTYPANESQAKLLPYGWRKTGGALLACLLLVGIFPKRRAYLSAILILFVLAGGLVSCGSAPSTMTTPGDYTILVTGTSGSITSQANVELHVQ